MRDPCLVALDDPITIGVLDRAGAKRPKVRAGIGFGKHSRGQDFTAGKTGQPFFLLRLRAARKDQLGRNLGPGAKRPNPDIAAAEFFRDNAHRRLGQAETAEFLGDGQAEHTHLGQFVDHLHRDQLILQMPFMGMGHDAVQRIAAELFADHLQLVVKAGIAHRDLGPAFAHQRDQAQPRGLRIARLGEDHHLGRGQSAQIFGRQTQILRTQDLGLIHLDAACDLGKVFTERDLVDQLLHLAELALFAQALGPSLHLAQRFDVSGQPRQTVGGGLVLFDRRARNAAIDRDQGRHAHARRVQQPLDRRKGGRAQR